jgi:dTDP-4-dehydrorhamnose 3,5-epimerase
MTATTGLKIPEALIPGVVCRPLVIYEDARGWLAELYRQDELDPEVMPVMSYISLTKPGVGRGPHAHRQQTDYFCFPGPGDFKVFLWDERPESPAYKTKQVFLLGESCPGTLVVPPGVIHGYLNTSGHLGLVINCANRLYKGPGRKEDVDEIRYENDPECPFRLE